jgi:hypothetical protein
VIVLGALLAVWGIVVLLGARPLHDNWREMNASMRRAGVPGTVWFTGWIASPAGLRHLRIAGGAALAVGLALLAAGGWQALG